MSYPSCSPPAQPPARRRRTVLGPCAVGERDWIPTRRLPRSRRTPGHGDRSSTVASSRAVATVGRIRREKLAHREKFAFAPNFVLIGQDGDRLGAALLVVPARASLRARTTPRPSLTPRASCQTARLRDWTVSRPVHDLRVQLAGRTTAAVPGKCARIPNRTPRQLTGCQLRRITNGNETGSALPGKCDLAELRACEKFLDISVRGRLQAWFWRALVANS